MSESMALMERMDVPTAVVSARLIVKFDEVNEGAASLTSVGIINCLKSSEILASQRLDRPFYIKRKNVSP